MTHLDYVGVDGCRCGWLAVGLSRGGVHDLEVFGDFRTLLERHRRADLVLVDIPIGLPHGPGGRDCDREARRMLGPRASAVFPTPTRGTVRRAAKLPGDYGGAAEEELRLTGKRISRQTFAICPKIAEVDGVMTTRGKHARPAVREVHPELCFWALNGGRPMKSSKKRREGLRERLEVLRAVEPRSGQIYGEACGKFARRCVARDDVLDALAAAVVALHGRDELRTLPERPPSDARELPMEIVYWHRGRQGR